MMRRLLLFTLIVLSALTAPVLGQDSGPRLTAEDFTYLGAFRLPADGERPLTFAYGGAAMTFNPAGDPMGDGDGFSGSLFISGHDRMPYGELPDGDQIAEISIPAPIVASTLDSLPTAAFVQGFTAVAAGAFVGLDEIPRLGLLYLDRPETGPRLHLAWGQHLQPEPSPPSHALFNPDLTAPDLTGFWSVDAASPYSVGGYLIEIPVAWAAAYVGDRVVGTGRFRDGGWSGMGPTLYAYRPWIDASGMLAADGAQLEAVELLHYASSAETETFDQAVIGYQHADEWEGGAWITTTRGASALLFAGTKGTGDRFWYGYVNPAGAALPCVDDDFVGEFPVCRTGDGGVCPAQEWVECSGHSDFRGWWASRFDAQFILYDAADLTQVVAGALEPWQPQPYAAIDIDDHLFLDPSGVETEMLGTGDQRRFRIGEVAYDRAGGRLYVLELFADDARPVVHVWQVD